LLNSFKANFIYQTNLLVFLR